MKRPAVIFDFGNVVAFFDYARATARLGGPFGLTGPDLLAKARLNGLNDVVKVYESGGMTSENFSTEVARLVGLEIDHETFVAAWGDIFWLNPSIAELIREIKTLGHPLVLGSNTNEIHANIFLPQFAEHFSLFDHLVLSFQIGHIKPTAPFYLACAEKAGAAPADCVFIDDLPENVAGANDAGLKGLLYVDTPSLRRDLKAMGVDLAG